MMKALSTMLLVTVSAPALAQAAGESSEDRKASNPDRVVCERYEETGSRLSTRRVCKTVREWEQQRQEQRADVERAQQNVGIQQGN